MPTDAPQGLINQFVVSPGKVKAAAKKAAEPAADDKDTAASKSDKAK
jgi:hypothetical protein